MICKQTKINGEQCKANSTKNSDFCFSHDPRYKVEKALAVKKGGLAPKKTLISFDEQITLETAKDAKLFLSKVINGVWQGQIPSTPVASTLGFLVRCFLDANDKSDIELRLEKIEQKLM